jgi:TRAP-type C4-dicarboxylate transport system permease small subunit
MAEDMSARARLTNPVGRALFAVAKGLAIFGGLLSCVMAVIVTVSVTGRYLFGMPIPGDYDLVGILCGCAIFSFLPYCQLVRGNVLVDFFTAHASARVKALLDAAGATLFLLIAILFTWRLYYGALDLRQSNEVIAAFNFYRWWTVPYDILCMIVLIIVIAYTLVDDIRDAAAGRAPVTTTVHGD